MEGTAPVDNLAYYDFLDDHPVHPPALPSEAKLAEVDAEARRLTAIYCRCRGIPKTPARTKLDFFGHAAPTSRRDNAGLPWRGTSRIVEPAARRQKNKRTWAALKAASRREAVAMRRQGEALLALMGVAS